MPSAAPFTLDNLSGLLATLIALSVAAERLVSIIKNLIPWLSIEWSNALAERVRNAILQLLSVVAGIATAALANNGDVLPAHICEARLRWNRADAVNAVAARTHTRQRLPLC